MKGFAIWKVVSWAIMLMVIAVALYFLTFVTNFDSLFLSNDQSILAKYSTCALALCAYGFDKDGNPSPEVNQVGCLKSEGGRCALTCAQAKEKIFDVKGINAEQQGDRRVFCGEGSRLDFQFSGISLGGVVPLVSGQMDKIANPAWLCKPWMPFGFSPDDFFGNIPGLTTADFLYHGTDSCIMLAKLSEVPVTTIANLFAPEGDRYAGGCFTGIVFDTQRGVEDLYTPIMEYKQPEEKVHPSGIYLDYKDSFTRPLDGASKPECDLEDPQSEFVITDADIETLAKKNEGRLFDRINPKTCTGPVSPENCEVKKVTFDELSDAEKKRVARLILKEEFGDIEFDDQCNTGRRFGRQCPDPSRIPKNPLGERITRCNFKTTYQNEKITYSVYSEATLPTPFALFDSCKTVTLDRNLENPAITEENKDKTEGIEQPTIVLSIEKNEYEVGETVRLTGTVENDKLDGRRFRSFSSEKAAVSYLNTRINVAAVDRVDVINGKFKSSFEIKGDVLRGATFRVTAEYKDTESNTVEFLVK